MSNWVDGRFGFSGFAVYSNVAERKLLTPSVVMSGSS